VSPRPPCLLARFARVSCKRKTSFAVCLWRECGAGDAEGYLYAVVNIVVDVFGAVMVKMYGGALGSWEINLIRFGSAAVQLDALLLAVATGYWSPLPMLPPSLLSHHPPRLAQTPPLSLSSRSFTRPECLRQVFWTRGGHNKDGAAGQTGGACNHSHAGRGRARTTFVLLSGQMCNGKRQCLCRSRLRKCAMETKLTAMEAQLTACATETTACAMAVEDCYVQCNRLLLYCINGTRLQHYCMCNALHYYTTACAMALEDCRGAQGQ